MKRENWVLNNWVDNDHVWKCPSCDLKTNLPCSETYALEQTWAMWKGLA